MKPLEFFYQRTKELYRLYQVRSLLRWDQAVMMPAGGTASRAEQEGTLAALVHDLKCDPRYVDTLKELVAEELSEDDSANVRQMDRSVTRSLKLPREFVTEYTKSCVMSEEEWNVARPKNDFKAVEPHLKKLLKLNREKAEYFGYENHIYDPLLDEFDQGNTIAFTKPILVRLGKALRDIIPEVLEKQGDSKLVQGEYPVEKQMELAREVATLICFDFDGGRLDISSHPFSTSIGQGDARITTRFDPENYLSGVSTLMHEIGHALYDQGFLPEHSCTPLGSAESLTLHESQSIFWERMVGGTKEFCEHLSQLAPKYFPGQPLTDDPDEIWRALNRVKPGLIRVEADQVTYSLHIVIRLLLEEALVTEDLAVKDLPGAWSDYYRQYLDLEVPDDRNGVMQDIHWYFGAFGYFPTYSLGLLTSAMLATKISEELGDLSQMITEQKFADILGWLRTNIHEHGQRYSSRELIKQVTGSELSEVHFISFLQRTYF